jgi:hypothetical protein
MRKAKKSNSDPFIALLNFRNTPQQVPDYSPVQQLIIVGHVHYFLWNQAIIRIELFLRLSQILPVSPYETSVLLLYYLSLCLFFNNSFLPLCVSLLWGDPHSISAIEFLQDSCISVVVFCLFFLTSLNVKLKQHFARWGIPETVIFDNGPQYSSEQFKNFSRLWDFKHRSCAVEWKSRRPSWYFMWF